MTEATADLAAPVSAIPPAALSYRRYALGVLLIVYILNFLDRQVVNILAEPIKNDLKLKDWQLGAMGGIAFGLFYTFLAIPIARAAERWSRPLIIAGSLTLWSGFTALSGLAQNFVQLCGARLGVGFGEAGCTPAAHSMIADDTPPKDRAFALSFYAMGTPLGGLMGLVIGAIVADAWGWRAAFFVAGAPGLLFALLVAVTLREPRRRRLAAQFSQARAEQASLVDTLRYLTGKPTFWLLASSAAVSAFIGYGQAQFTASFFLRTHTAEVAQLAAGFGWKSLTFVGISTGVLGGLGGAAGSVLGGKITDALRVKDLRAYATVPAVAALLWAPLYVLSALAPTAKLALLIGIVPSVLGTLWYGPIYATAQSVVPPNMRATTSALLLFIISLVGLGLGPVFTGAVSDYLSTPARLGPAHGVQWSLVITAAFALPSMLLALAARRTVRADLVS